MSATSAPPADPMRAVLKLGKRASRDGIYIGLIVALLSHTSAVASPRLAMKYTMMGMRQAVADMRVELRSHLFAVYDVEIIENEPVEEEEEEPQVEEPEPEVEEPEPEVEPEVEETEPVIEPTEPPPDSAEPESEDDIYEEPPPAAAEAADVLTADEDTSGPKDLTGFTIVDKDGSKSSGGGYTSKTGRNKGPQYNRNAKGGVNSGGKGKGDGKTRRRPKKNLSRGATPLSGGSWNCPFPPQADLEQVDRATAVVVVVVGPDGRARSARVVSDPGYGFGAQAQRCALGQRYRPAWNADGKPITSTTPPINVRFSR